MFKRHLIRTGGSKGIVIPASLILDLQWTYSTHLYIDLVNEETLVITSEKPAIAWDITLKRRDPNPQPTLKQC